MALVRRNCWLTARACEIHSQCRRWRRLRPWQLLTIRATFRRVVTNNADQCACSNRCSIEVRLQMVQTSTNFLYCDGRRRLDRRPAVARRRSKRPASPSMGSSNCIRVTIGRPEQNQFLVCAFRKIVVTIGQTDRSQLNRPKHHPGGGPIALLQQPGVAAQQSACDDSLAASAGQNLRRSALLLFPKESSGAVAA